MRIFWLIAKNTFTDAVRNKVLYGVVAFAAAFALLSLAMGSLSLGADQRLALNSGLLGASALGIGIAVFLGVLSLFQELERKTIYTILSRPIPRFLFVLGKFFGLAFVLLVEVSLMTLIVVASMTAKGLPLSESFFFTVLLLFTEIVMVLGIAMVFSSFSSPFLSGLFTLGTVIAGRLLNDVIGLVERTQGNRADYITPALRIIPDLQLFHVEPYLISGDIISRGYVAWAMGYGASYTALSILLSIYFFHRRDFL